VAGDAIAIALALVALGVSLLAYRSAAVGRGERPVVDATGLRVRVREGQARRSLSDDVRDYALLTELTNDTDAAVTISSVRLRVTYRTRANFLGVVDLDPRPEPPPAAAGKQNLVLPLVVPARSAVTRSAFFTTSNVIPRHCRVQDYALVASAPDGVRVVADASLPSLLAADTDGQGPATWGWD
jgi:hypothetical protein